MSILDKFNDASRGVSEKAKNISEANNLKRKIAYEEERIVEIFTDIGKKYYKEHGEDLEALKALCDDIDTRRRRIKRMRYDLNGIRGYKVCPKCDAEVNERFQFCGRCGGGKIGHDGFSKVALGVFLDLLRELWNGIFPIDLLDVFFVSGNN